MLNFNSKIAKERVKRYIIDSAYDYCYETFKYDGNEHEPSDEEIMNFVVNDIKRVMDYRMVYGIMPMDAVIDYLQGLSLAIDFTYYDDWNRMQYFLDGNKKFENATEAEIDKNDEKYWRVLATEIKRWF